MSDAWLTDKEYRRIRYRAKKMGATDIDLSHIWHTVGFEHTSVDFVFARPLKYRLNLKGSCSVYRGDFETKEDVEKITADMNKALEFVEFLKEFEKTAEYLFVKIYGGHKI